MGPRSFQVRLGTNARSGERFECHGLHTQLGDLVGVAQSKLRALDDERPEGLAELDAGNVAGPVRKPDDRPHLFDFREQRHVRLSGLGPAGEEDAPARPHRPR